MFFHYHDFSAENKVFVTIFISQENTVDQISDSLQWIYGTHGKFITKCNKKVNDNIRDYVCWIASVSIHCLPYSYTLPGITY